jgi:ADP-ribose pyrophosphatase
MRNDKNSKKSKERKDARMKERLEYLKLITRYPDAFRNPDESNLGIHIATDPKTMDVVEEEIRKRLSAKGLPEEWAEVGIVYQDQYSMILRDAVHFQPGNTAGTYIRRFKPGEIAGVVILPIYRQSVCMVKIFRHALRRYVLELPRGFSEPKQTPLQNAERELLEEIGGKVQHIYEMGCMTENSGMSNERAVLFYAELEEVGPVSEEEGIEKVVFVPVNEFAAMIREGSLEDSFSLCTALRAILLGYLKL